MTSFIRQIDFNASPLIVSIYNGDVEALPEVVVPTISQEEHDAACDAAYRKGFQEAKLWPQQAFQVAYQSCQQLQKASGAGPEYGAGILSFGDDSNFRFFSYSASVIAISNKVILKPLAKRSPQRTLFSASSEDNCFHTVE